ncbi:MAG: ATP-binding protein [Desulfobacterales bacterium]|jgi:PAS domain S-box-containing protein
MGIVLTVFVLIGIAVFGLVLAQQEKESKLQDLLDRGRYLTGLIALHPTADLKGGKQDFFLRTLTENTSHEGFVYCYMHDQSQQPFVSLVPKDIASDIPHEVQAASLKAMGLSQQTYQLNGTKSTLYEFAKPIFENGKKSGTVRLGFKLPHVSLFSFERIRFLAIITLFIFVVMLFLYYGLMLTLQPLNKLNRDIQKLCKESDKLGTPSPNNESVVCMVKDFGQNIGQIKDRLTKIESDNMDLASKLGVTSFEKKQIATILNSIPLGIIIADIHNNISYVNKYMLKLLNKDHSESIGCPLEQILEDDELRLFISLKENGMGYKIGNYIESTFPKSAPGDTFNISVSELKNIENGLVGKMIIVRKVTNEKMAEEARRDFIAHLSHEFKTPLTTIKSYSEMLMDGEVNEAETTKDFYNIINMEADRLSSLVQNLLSISRMEMGNLTLNTALVKIDLLVKDSLTAIETAVNNKNILLEKNVSENSPSLMGDKELLKVAIINILSNAVKYTPQNGKVTFSLFNQNGHIIFDVADTGCGISPKDLPYIFDKTYRSEDPVVREVSGSGLGLAIAQEIIQLHGGEIEVRSESGKGSQFTIKLPQEEYHLGIE